MKKIKILTLLLTILQLYSFKENTACDLVNSNLSYATKQATKAENAPTLNTLKYYTYKAVKTIQKLDKQMTDCGCNEAEINISGGLILLKNATKSESISIAKLLLEKAKKNIAIGIASIEAYSLNSKLNSETIKTEHISLSKTDYKDLYAKIDSILIPFEKSINSLTETNDCNETYNLALKIYEKSEIKLLNTNITEAKKYYNIRTKEITKVVIDKLKDCVTN